MKVSLNWLSQYIDIPYSNQELADKLTMAGIEVEAIEDSGAIPEGIIVAEILERNPHPEADKLSVCRVSTGTEELQIVCGAPNCNAGVKAPLATIGTVFEDPDGGKPFKIKKSKLRGVPSFGMLCSSSELGLDGDHSGILELPADTEVGTPLSEVIKSDIIYVVEITPNRPDWLSHWGVARDIAALTGNKLKFPEITLSEPAIDKKYAEGLVEVKDFDLCPRYTGRVIKNVQIKESPSWLKERLLSIGLRPINNIVDITNFVLHELGHPLHAFDLDLLAGEKIIVRRAGNGEKIVTLDGEVHELADRHLVIADAEKPVALAGVMGGEHSGVTEKTVNVLLESATFDKSNIRATSRELNISSDSSYRFERGVDYNNLETASDRATALILELAGGELVTDLVDVKSEYQAPAPFECRFERIRKTVGVDLKNEEIIEIFKRLGLGIDQINGTSCMVTVPSYRLDIFREADLAEEVARIHGLQDIPAVPVAAVTGGSILKDAYIKIQKTGEELVSIGLYECVNLSLVEEKDALIDTRFSKDELVRVKNPISLELEVMRPSLFPQMLETVKRNISRKNMDLALFEIGTVFANKKKYTEERYECCIALTGRKHPERFSSELEDVYDFYDLKGLLEEWLLERKINNLSFRPAEDARFKNGVCAEILAGEKCIGIFGEISSKLAKGIRTKNAIFTAVIQLDDLLDANADKIVFKPISQYPSVTRDVAFVADESLAHQAVIELVAKAKLKNLVKVELFDIFRDEKALGKGRKSLAYEFTFRNNERTLTDKEVNKAYEFIRKKLAQNLSVELR